MMTSNEAKVTRYLVWGMMSSHEVSEEEAFRENGEDEENGEGEEHREDRSGDDSLKTLPELPPTQDRQVTDSQNAPKVWMQVICKCDGMVTALSENLEILMTY